MTYVFDPSPQPTLPVKGTDQLFPIHRIYCVGRNYAEHTKEMGGDTKDPPFFFQKNPDNVVTDGKFPYPAATKNVHFEIELVVALKSGGTNIKAADAMQHVFGYARRHRHDAPRPAGRGQEAGASLGGGQGLRALGPVHGAGAGQARRDPGQGRDLARGQRRARADRRPRADDLGRPAPDRVPVGPVRAQGRRPDLHRHALGRRRHQEGRPAQGPRRRHRRPRSRPSI